MDKAHKNTWKPASYDDKAGFVSQLGKGVVELLNPQRGEKILDIGCGTGDLTYFISKSGSIPLGIDLSPSMIKEARQKYPEIPFLVANAENFQATELYDAVFSNAALHWMNPLNAVATVWQALRPGGRFVAEFGGKGNVETVIKGITDVLAKYDISAAKLNPWYYPTIGEFSSLLEKRGFRVTYAIHFSRPTSLQEGENGLSNWLDIFANKFFEGFSSTEKQSIYKELIAQLKFKLFIKGTWVLDYQRIRVMAYKKGAF